MPEVAYFLAITAEEESATALFHALKRRRYANAGHLKPKNHIHKTALHPFLLAVGKLFTEVSAWCDPMFVFDTEQSPGGKELLRLRLTVDGPDGKPIWAHPLPPLEFSVSVNGTAHDFGPELQRLASEKNARSAKEYVELLANRRNQVLYAAPNGMPHVEHDPMPFLQYRKSVVFSHLIAYLLVDPFPQRQLFVQQTLNAFVAMLGYFPSGDET